MNSVRALLLTSLALAIPTSGALASADDWVGPYAGIGFAIGIPSVDWGDVGLPAGVDTSGGAAFGFVATGGWRVLPWLAGEAELSYMGGGEAEATFGAAKATAKYDLFTFVISAKGYPLPLFDTEWFDGNLEPYAAFGIGGGKGGLGEACTNVAIPGVGGPGCTDLDLSEGAFIARFGGGLDYHFNETWSGYLDMNYFITNKEIITGFGGIRIGATYHFDL